ncbi:MAG TPA: PAS domain-containing protein [Gaiellales bacterium]
MARPQSRYLLMGALIVVIALVNAVSFVLVRDAGSTLHDQATPRSLAVEQLRLDIADMNGAQNLYLIDPGGGRPVYVASRTAVRRDLAAVRPLETSADGRATLAGLIRDERAFERVDGQIWSSLQAGQVQVARSLAAGAETTTYTRMTAQATALDRDAVARRVAALDSYNTRERIALAVSLTFAAAALALTVVLLTERLRTGRRLDTSEAQFRTLLEELPAAVRIYDSARDRVTYANPRYLEMYGYTRRHIDSGLPLHWAERLHDDDRDRVVHGWLTAAARGRPWWDRYRWVSIDGQVLWVSDSERSLPGEPGQRLGIAMDVTEQEQVAAELEEQRRRYRTLVERMPLVVYIDGRAGDEAVYVSPQIETVLGVGVQEWYDAVGDVGFWERHVHPDDLERVKRAMGYDMPDRPPADYTILFRFLRGDGQYRWIVNEDVEVTGDDGRPLWRQGLIRDVHDRMLAEQRWEDLIHRLPGTVALWDKATESTVYASPHIEQLTGERPELWLGREGFERFRSRVHPDDLNDPERWRTDGMPSTYRWRRSDGREIWIREIDAPSPERESGIGVLLFDATVEMTAQMQLRDAQRKALESLAALVTAAEEERSRIATELHDDTVSDLTAVLMHIRLQMRRRPELEPLERVVSQALERTRRLMFELRPHILAHDGLHAAVEQTLKVAPAEQEWESAVDIDIPRQSDTLEALAYRSIRELVVNARKHSRAAHISVRGREVGGELEFVVQDDGVGFDPQAVALREGAILHIGLSSTRERLELAGGSLAIDAAPGAGARFTITLPAQPREQGAAPSPLTGEPV